MENPFASDEGKAQIQRRLPGVDANTVHDYLTDAWARVIDVAPCMATDGFPSARFGQATGMLTRIILRWHRGGERDLTPPEKDEAKRLCSWAPTFFNGPHARHPEL